MICPVSSQLGVGHSEPHTPADLETSPAETTVGTSPQVHLSKGQSLGADGSIIESLRCRIRKCCGFIFRLNCLSCSLPAPAYFLPKRNLPGGETGPSVPTSYFQASLGYQRKRCLSRPSRNPQTGRDFCTHVCIFSYSVRYPFYPRATVYFQFTFSKFRKHTEVFFSST